MAAQLVMAGAGQPVVHDPTHDLESFFYVLVGICVLLNGPYKPKCDNDLAQCFDKYAENNHNPVRYHMEAIHIATHFGLFQTRHQPSDTSMQRYHCTPIR